MRDATRSSSLGLSLKIQLATTSGSVPFSDSSGAEVEQWIFHSNCNTSAGFTIFILKKVTYLPTRELPRLALPETAHVSALHLSVRVLASTVL